MAGRKGRSGGRNRKPTALHLVNGTHRPDRHGDRDAARAEAKVVRESPPLRPPPKLSREARKEWRRLEAELRTAGVLTMRDRAVLTGYCLAWARLREAEEDIERLGTLVEGTEGTQIRNPALTTWNQAMSQLRMYAAELGLSPSARARVTGPTKRPEGAADVPAEFGNAGPA